MTGELGRDVTGELGRYRHRGIVSKSARPAPRSAVPGAHLNRFELRLAAGHTHDTQIAVLGTIQGVTMKIFGSALVAIALSIVLLPATSRAEPATNPPELARAAEAYGRGNIAAALKSVEELLARSPANPAALFQAAEYNFRMGDFAAARARLENLVKLPSFPLEGMELLVVVAQAQGDRTRRDDLLNRLRYEIGPAERPRIKTRSDIVRDRIPIPGGEIVAVEYFQRNGMDFTRYLFSPYDPRARPDLGILLRTDLITTNNWANTALLPDNKALFHLDLVEQDADGSKKTGIYQYYVGEPDYDTVRAKVMEILRGDAKPVAGEPGKLAGILKR